MKFSSTTELQLAAPGMEIADNRVRPEGDGAVSVAEREPGGLSEGTGVEERLRKTLARHEGLVA